jgi:hypothetical protein
MAGPGHNGGPKPNNWVAVDRDMRFHPVVGFLNKDGTPRKGVIVSETDAWFDLVCEANWRDREANNKGQVVLIERGQLIGAGAWLAQRWGWTRDKVRWFLKKLEAEHMITVSSPSEKKSETNQNRTQSNTQKRAHYANIITLCNYNLYQTLRELDAHLSTLSDTQSTPNQHPHHNKGTNTQTGARTHEEDWPAGDFVKVNGAAIYVSLLGKRLKFEYAAIDQWAALGMCKSDTARQIVEAEARGWVADQKWPDTPSRWLQKQIGNWRVHKAVAETRIENEKKRGEPRGLPKPGKSFLDSVITPASKPRPADEVI